MHWAQFMELCLVSPECDDSASSALFAQTLASFTVDYYDLLQRLASLPGQPRVIVNEYYDPLAAKPDCPSQPELTAAKSAVLLTRLTTFNRVLADGAASFGFEAVAPSFTGHELCTAQPFVQGLDDSAPCIPMPRASWSSRSPTSRLCSIRLRRVRARRRRPARPEPATPGTASW